MGLVVPTLFILFCSGRKGYLRQTPAHGYSLIITSEESPQLERREIDQMIARRVDAFSGFHRKSFLQSSSSKELYLLYCLPPGFGLTAICWHQRRGGWPLATKHLIRSVARPLPTLAALRKHSFDRRMGYQQTLADHGMTLPPGYTVKQVDHDGDSTGYASMKKLLLLNPRPDGLFCYNDTVALGAMQAVLEAGLKIPGDIAIIGCGNAHFDNLLQVPLTSIDQDAEGLGDKASRLALALIHRKNLCAKTVPLKIKLVIRGSTQR
jgi:LacI family transcriptional regulator